MEIANLQKIDGMKMYEFYDKWPKLAELSYKKEFTVNDIKCFLKAGIVSGIHIEPCSDLILDLDDKLFSKRHNYFILYI